MRQLSGKRTCSTKLISPVGTPVGAEEMVGLLEMVGVAVAINLRVKEKKRISYVQNLISRC
jgi:hypothetical protein